MITNLFCTAEPSDPFANNSPVGSNPLIYVRGGHNGLKYELPIPVHEFLKRPSSEEHFAQEQITFAIIWLRGKPLTDSCKSQLGIQYKWCSNQSARFL